MSFFNCAIKNSTYLFGCLLAFMLISFATPPVQSPDEGSHLTRSYLLSQGVIVMGHEGEEKTGGRINSGLSTFISTASKVGAGNINQYDKELKSIQWSEATTYSVAFNTAYNYPAVYLPQAISFLIGKTLNIRVLDTYYLARLMNFLSALTILLYAAKINPLPISVIAVLLLPMTMFQLSSPVLDSITIALTVLIMSLICASKNKPIELGSFLLLLISCFLVSTSKANMLPICALPFLANVNINKKFKIILSITPFALSIIWVVTALTNTNDGGVHHVGYSQGDVIKHYITHPVQTFIIIINTITDPELVKFYYKSFIGILGPLNVPLSKAIYPTLSVLLLLTIATCLIPKKKDKVKFSVLVVSLGCIGLIFCALLVQWNEFPAIKIDGIQGRYFIPPIIVLLFGIPESDKYRDAMIKFMLPTIYCVSLYASVYSLISYYR